MTKAELMAIINEAHDQDEIVILSPGRRPIEITGIDFGATNDSGALVLNSKWQKK